MPDGATPQVQARAKIKFVREPLWQMYADMGPLMRMHDREIWPDRTWGPRGRVIFNIRKYLILEGQGAVHCIAARSGPRLVGYCLEVLDIDDHYGMRGTINQGFFLHPDFRKGEGLAIRKSPAFLFLIEREKLLDELKSERRRIGVKMWKDFGPILQMFGYEEDMRQFHKVASFQEGQ